MTLTDFLLARIAEDEAVARACPPTWAVEPEDGLIVDAETGAQVCPGGGINYDQGPRLEVAQHIARHDPARVLAQCGAKRRIVEELALPYIAERRRLMNGQPSWGDEHPELLLLLALPYADHPDYREEWRP